MRVKNLLKQQKTVRNLTKTLLRFNYVKEKKVMSLIKYKRKLEV